MTQPDRSLFGVPLSDSGDASALLSLINGRRGELNEKMGIEMVTASPDRLTATMPVAGNRQPMGLLHGGASAVLAETLGSTHAAMIAPPDTQPVGTELNCSHHRSATAGTVTAESTVLHAGRTLATFEIVVRDDEGRRVCTARLSCYFRPVRPRPDTRP